MPVMKIVSKFSILIDLCADTVEGGIHHPLVRIHTAWFLKQYPSAVRGQPWHSIPRENPD
jgi:hypothetical protein